MVGVELERIEHDIGQAERSGRSGVGGCDHRKIRLVRVLAGRRESQHTPAAQVGAQNVKRPDRAVGPWRLAQVAKVLKGESDRRGTVRLRAGDDLLFDRTRSILGRCVGQGDATDREYRAWGEAKEQSGQEGLVAQYSASQPWDRKSAARVTKKATRSPSRMAWRVELRRPLRA